MLIKVGDITIDTKYVGNVSIDGHIIDVEYLTRKYQVFNVVHQTIEEISYLRQKYEHLNIPELEDLDAALCGLLDDLGD